MDLCISNTFKSIEFKFDRLCEVGTVITKSISGYYSNLNFYAEKLGELNNSADDWIHEVLFDDFLLRLLLIPLGGK